MIKIPALGKKLFLFLFIFFLINQAFRYYFYNVSMKNHKLFVTDSEFYESNDTISHLFLGHSRALQAIDDSIIENSNNFCMATERNSFSYYKLKYILEKTDKKFDKVILPYGFGFLFNLDTWTTFKSYYWIKYVNYIELGEKKGKFFPYLVLWLKTKLFPYYQYMHTWIGYLPKTICRTENAVPFHQWSEQKKIQAADLWMRKNENRQALRDNIYTALGIDAGIDYLKETINLCNKYDKQIIFIKYPVTKYCHDAQKEFIEKNNLNFTFVDSIIANNGNHIIWDFTDIYFVKDEYFRDIHHMNAKGRNVFSKMLNEKLKSLEH